MEILTFSKLQAQLDDLQDRIEKAHSHREEPLYVPNVEPISEKALIRPRKKDKKKGMRKK